MKRFIYRGMPDIYMNIDEMFEPEEDTFALGNKYYSMFAWDSDLTDDEWYSMAEELLAE